MIITESNEDSFIGIVGAVIAGLLSWVTWHSVPWAIINGLCSWFYVIYWCIHYWDSMVRQSIPPCQ